MPAASTGPGTRPSDLHNDGKSCLSFFEYSRIETRISSDGSDESAGHPPPTGR